MTFLQKSFNPFEQLDFINYSSNLFHKFCKIYVKTAIIQRF